LPRACEVGQGRAIGFVERCPCRIDIVARDLALCQGNQIDSSGAAGPVRYIDLARMDEIATLGQRLRGRP
jgi:hypothetical protein